MTSAQRPMRVAVAIARAWTWVYTCGVDTPAREQRRNEIDSDLWESLEDARVDGTGPAATALHIVLRVFLGAGDDLLWRIADAPRPLRRSAVWWATTAVALGALTAAAVIVLIAAAPAKLPLPPAPGTTSLYQRAPPPLPPPPPPDARRIAGR